MRIRRDAAHLIGGGRTGGLRSIAGQNARDMVAVAVSVYHGCKRKKGTAIHHAIAPKGIPQIGQGIDAAIDQSDADARAIQAEHVSRKIRSC